MEVVLKEDMENLGHMGDVVKVRDGYARNYLLPRGLAMLADKKSLKALEHQQRMIAQRRERLTREAAGISDRLSRVSIEFAVKVGEEGRLFGSVTNMDIEKALKEKGFEVERRRIVLEAPIKTVGDYEVPIRLRPEVTPSIRVKVVSENEPKAVEAEAVAAEPTAAAGSEAPSAAGEEAFMRAVTEGLSDLEAGREVSSEEAKSRLGLK